MIYLDANIIIYAVNSDPTYGDACARILMDIERGRVRVGASSLTLLEVLGALRKINGILTRKKKQPLDIEKNIDALTALPIVWFDLTPLLVERSLDYHDTGLHTADAVHVATALMNDMTTILSADTDFDAAASGLVRLDPLDYTAR